MASILDERGFNQGFELTVAQRVRLRRRAEAIVAEMKLPSSADARRAVKVLEIGCGTGDLAMELAVLSNAAVTGVDVSPKFIDHATEAHRLPGLEFVMADLSHPPPQFQTTRYDYIVGNGILHHLFYQLAPFLLDMKQWLRPGGKIIFWEPNLANPYIYLIFSYAPFRRLARLEPDEMAFSARRISKQLRDAGYTAIKVDIRDFLLPNTPTPLIKTGVRAGDWLERLPIIRFAAQSLFIRAENAPA